MTELPQAVIPQHEGANVPRRKVEAEQKLSPAVCLQITRPVPGLTPRWVGALLMPDKKIACNRVPDAEILTILEHPECYRIIQDGELVSAVQPWVERPCPEPLLPVKASRNLRPRPHLRVD